MKIMFKEFIQIAGIIDEKEAQMLISCGVSYLGFPLRPPVNKEDLTEEEASQIISGLHPPNQGILITYLDNAVEIKKLSDKIGTKIIQLHGKISIDELNKFKSISPESIVIKSLIVGKSSKEKLFEAVTNFENIVDAFITDSFNPQTGATGATGITHDWNTSKEFVDFSKKPIILAGGLNPENVCDAIVKVRPAGVDTHTGVEGVAGRKIKIKVVKFVEEAIRGFRMIREDENDL